MKIGVSHRPGAREREVVVGGQEAVEAEAACCVGGRNVEACGLFRGEGEMCDRVFFEAQKWNQIIQKSLCTHCLGFSQPNYE